MYESGEFQKAKIKNRTNEKHLFYSLYLGVFLKYHFLDSTIEKRIVIEENVLFNAQRIQIKMQTLSYLNYCIATI